MTNDEPAPPPGPELDLEIHVKVFGVPRPETYGTALGTPSWWDGEHLVFCPKYSSDESWFGLRLLVGRLRELGYSWSAGTLSDGQYTASFLGPDGSNWGRWATGDSVPEATAKAALRALAGGRDGD